MEGDRRPEPLGRRLGEAVGWVTSLDGTLLDDESWAWRHRLLLALVAVNGAVATAAGIAAHHGWGLWPSVAVLAGGLGVAAWTRPARRTRQFGVAIAMAACAVLENRYVGNLAGLTTAYILLL